MKVLRHLLTAVLGSLILATVSSQAASDTTATLYVHFGFESSDSTKRLPSARVHLGEPIFVGGEDYWKLTGSIERRGTNLVAEPSGSVVETRFQGAAVVGVGVLAKTRYQR